VFYISNIYQINKIIKINIYLLHHVGSLFKCAFINNTNNVSGITLMFTFEFKDPNYD
jgi:hypothetical protein